MLKGKLFRKYARLTVVLTVATLLFASFAPGAFAFNYNGGGGGTGNKSFDFNGYELVDLDTLKIFFNKSASKTTEIDASQFTVTKRGGSAVSFTMAESTGSGCSDYRLTQGTTETLTFSSSLDYDSLYDVVIKAKTVADDNYLTLGNYRGGADFKFSFRTPDSSGNYSTTVAPVVSYTLDTNQTDSTYSESGVAYEHNLGVCFDRPMYNDSTTITNFLNSLSSNYTMTQNGSGTVVQDSTIDDNTPVTNGQCYTPHANDAHTFFFFPQTVNTNSYAAYNRFCYTSGGVPVGGVTYGYRLTLPDFVQYGNNKTWTSSDAGYAAVDQFDFTSANYDQVGWLDNRPTVSGTDDSVTVSWSASGITGASTPSANRYDVYRSTNRWDPGTRVVTDTSDTSVNDTLPVEGTYYYRVVPKYSGTPDYPDAGYSVPSDPYTW